MTDAELIALAVRMRTAQKAYFETRTSQNLANAKSLERQFDVEAAKREQGQGTLV